MFFNPATVLELNIFLESHKSNLVFTAETTKPFQQTNGQSLPPENTVQQVQ